MRIGGWRGGKPLPNVPEPQPTLTDAEREAVAWAERFARSQRDSRDNAADYAATLRGLLERL